MYSSYPVLTLHRVPAPPPEADGFADRLIYQTEEWVRFISRSHGAEPVWAELRHGETVVGYLTGLLFSVYGVRILGSPFPGWTTPYLGFNLTPDVPRWRAVAALDRFAFETLGCLHFEIVDRYLTLGDASRLEAQVEVQATHETDLRQTEDELFSAMTSACRRCIRKALKSGVLIEEANDAGFAAEYYAQLQEVFHRQRLVPTYAVDRVNDLIECFRPTGRLLLLRARAPDGRCIASGIYPGMNTVAQLWGNASLRSGLPLRPNELLHWYAMRYWKARGIERFDWGGKAAYKEKYGCTSLEVPRVLKSRFRLLRPLRAHAFALTQRYQRIRGWLAASTVARAARVVSHN